MNIIRYSVILLIVSMFSLNVIANEKSGWEEQANRLRGKIYSSIRKNGSKEEFSVDEIREALILSCDFSASCSRAEFANLRAGKQPKPYDEKAGLLNARKILNRKGGSPSLDVLGRRLK